MSGQETESETGHSRDVRNERSWRATRSTPFPTHFELGTVSAHVLYTPCNHAPVYSATLSQATCVRCTRV